MIPDIINPGDVATLAQRIIDSLAKPFMLDDARPFLPSVSASVCIPTTGPPLDRLLQNADTAMYHPKTQGKNNFQFFSRAMNVELIRAVEMETTLRRAMENNGLMVYYQPVVSCKTGEILSTEALLRVTDRSGQVVSAGPFIPVAEEKGLIIPLGEWVLRTACVQARRWQEAGLPSLKVAVNVSMRQLRQRGIVKIVQGVLREKPV